MRTKDSVWVRTAVLSAVVLLVTILTFLVQYGGDYSGNAGGDALNCSVEGDGNLVSCSGNKGPPTQSIDDKLMADAERFADVPPQRPGPWPFAVVRTLDLGLRVRSTNAVSGEALGALAPHHVAWAVCQERSAFDPDPTTGIGPVWLKIKWDQQEPSTSFHQSNPDATATAWAYRGYLVPVGHSGDIPQC